MVSSILLVVMTVASIVTIVGVTQRDNIQNLIEANRQETLEQKQTAVEDSTSAKYYAEPPKENTCKLNESTSRQGYYTNDGMFREKDVRSASLQCTFADMSSSVTQISEDKIDLVKSRLSYCNEIIEHRSTGLDLKPMQRCLFDDT